jgi:hypothetical protein
MIIAVIEARKNTENQRRRTVPFQQAATGQVEARGPQREP